MPELPVLRLELSQMKHTIQVAMTEYTIQLDEMLQIAIKEYCTPENLRKIVTEQTRITIDKTVRDAVVHWFMYSEDGQALIKKAVAAKLKEEAKYYE